MKWVKHTIHEVESYDIACIGTINDIQIRGFNLNFEATKNLKTEHATDKYGHFLDDLSHSDQDDIEDAIELGGFSNQIR